MVAVSPEVKIEITDGVYLIALLTRFNAAW
jgi:hypothetical protein